jgi:L-glyceraldehyde 3-phosphate reductase
LTDNVLEKSRKLNELAKKRGQTLAQMALAWILKDNKITSVIIGASSVLQIDDNLKSLDNCSFSLEEQEVINKIV